jgi:hypothetical protein
MDAFSIGKRIPEEVSHCREMLRVKEGEGLALAEKDIPGASERLHGVNCIGVYPRWVDTPSWLAATLCRGLESGMS